MVNPLAMISQKKQDANPLQKFSPVMDYVKRLPISKMTIYEITFGKAAGPRPNYLEWDGDLPKSLRDRINAQWTIDFGSVSPIPPEQVMRGSMAYELLAGQLGGQEKASAFLSRTGLSGIAYSDGESTYRYVDFEEEKK